MDWHILALGFHLLGFAVGVGGATISDIMFFKALKKRLLSNEHFGFLRVLSNTVWIGLIILIISGLAMFALIYAEQGNLPMLASPRWQTKLTLVAIVAANGFFFMSKIFPALRSLVGQQLNLANVGPLIGRLSFSGTVSIVSWYGILIVSLLPRSFRPPYWQFMGVYLFLIVCGIIVSRYMIAKTVADVANKSINNTIK